MKKILTFLLVIFMSTQAVSQIEIVASLEKECLKAEEDVIFIYSINNKSNESLYLLRRNLRFYQTIFSEDGSELNLEAKILAVYFDPVDNDAIEKSRFGDLILLTPNSKITFKEKMPYLFEKYNLISGKIYTFKSSYSSFMMKKRKHKGIPILFSDQIPINDLEIIVCE